MAGNKELNWAFPKAVSKAMTIELFKKSGWKISTIQPQLFPIHR